VALAVPANALSDWAADLARKAVGAAAREGIEEALEDEAEDWARGAARAAVPYVEAARRELYEREEVAAAVSTGVEVAMQAAGVADALDDAVDVTKTMKKVNDIRKVFR
jgi:hypothetical protein